MKVKQLEDEQEVSDVSENNQKLKIINYGI